MESKRELTSGRNLKRYEVKDGCYEVVNGPQKYNRILYGVLTQNASSRFRAIAGDKPEIMMYLPGDGGRAFFGLQTDKGSKWFDKMDSIRTRYKDGGLYYEMKDFLLQGGKLKLNVLPLSDKPGIVVKISSSGVPEGTSFLFAFGGASCGQDNRAMDAGYTSEEKVIYNPSMCEGNEITEGERSFTLKADVTEDGFIQGRVSFGGSFFKVDARCIEKDPESLEILPDGELRVVLHKTELANDDFEGYVVITHTQKTEDNIDNSTAGEIYNRALKRCSELASRVNVATPDKTIDAAVKAACIASEASFLPPIYVHGAWSWDIPIMGWRSMYGPAAFGWHDRVMEEARFFTGLQLDENLEYCSKRSASILKSSRFSSDSVYFGREQKIETLEPLGRPDPDPAYHLARQSAQSIFISPGMMPYMPITGKKAMYNMSEVFMDEILYEYAFLGDKEFAREMFPAIKRYIEWEKRCFDSDKDGLYENFANYWASDGIFASGAGCALASAYNYRANIVAAEMAEELGEDPFPFLDTADKIKKAVNEILWLEKDGHLAECVDTYGEKLKHTMLSLPTIVHAVESGILDDFQIYQLMKYTENVLERTSVEGCDGELVWNSNWVPYEWSVRDIDYADVMQASLSYFKIGRVKEGYRLLSGAVTDSTCNHVSPGGFMCVYEGKSVDFSDTVSTFDRTIVEGLFGIRPQMNKRKMVISPGFPHEWDKASISTPDISYVYSFKEGRETIKVTSNRECEIEIRLIARGNSINRVTVGGTPANYIIEPGIGHSYIVVTGEKGSEISLAVEYASTEISAFNIPKLVALGDKLEISSEGTKVTELKDPQRILEYFSISENGHFLGTIAQNGGNHSFFLQIEDGMLSYWLPVDVDIKAESDGSNESSSEDACDYHSLQGSFKKIPLGQYFNDKTADIFRHEYLSPRSPTCSLQVPINLYPSDWCVTSPEKVRMMNDSLLRASVGADETFITQAGIPFLQESQKDALNVVYVSRWDNFPTSAEIDINCTGREMHLLLTGYTNQMQCGVVNGIIEVVYYDGTKSELSLIPPFNFRSIEKGPETEREVDRGCYGEKTLCRVRIGDINANDTKGPGKKYSAEGIFAQVLQIELKPGQEIKSLKIRAIANDVVIGLMGISIL